MWHGDIAVPRSEKKYVGWLHACSICHLDLMMPLDVSQPRVRDLAAVDSQRPSSHLLFPVGTVCIRKCILQTSECRAGG